MCMSAPGSFTRYSLQTSILACSDLATMPYSEHPCSNNMLSAGVSLGEAGRGRVGNGGHSGAHSSALRGQQPAWTAVCGLQG